MFEVIGAYIKNIALIMLLAVLAEMTVPDAKIKKYVSVAIGIAMIFAVGGKIFSLMGLITQQDISIPALSIDNYGSVDTEETYDIKSRITNILYDEMNGNKVDDIYENNDGLGIKVERVSPFN